VAPSRKAVVVLQSAATTWQWQSGFPVTARGGLFSNHIMARWIRKGRKSGGGAAAHAACAKAQQTWSWLGATII